MLKFFAGMIWMSSYYNQELIYQLGALALFVLACDFAINDYFDKPKETPIYQSKEERCKQICEEVRNVCYSDPDFVKAKKWENSNV